MNLKKEILCLFIKSEKMAGSKARYNVMGKLAFSQEALWKTSEETNLVKAGSHITQQNSTKQLERAHLWTSRWSGDEQRIGV